MNSTNKSKFDFNCFEFYQRSIETANYSPGEKLFFPDFRQLRDAYITNVMFADESMINLPGASENIFYAGTITLVDDENFVFVDDVPLTEFANGVTGSGISYFKPARIVDWQKSFLRFGIIDGAPVVSVSLVFTYLQNHSMR